MNVIHFILPIAIATTLYMILFLDKQKKLRAWQAFWLALGCWLMIATIVWLATVLQLYGLKESKNVWDIASMVFTFLGTILTAGSTITAIAALISYISINDKLKKAEQDLNSAQEILNRFNNSAKDAEDGKNQSEKDFNTIEPYKIDEVKRETEPYNKIDTVKIQDLITNTETNQSTESAESAAEQILKSDYSQFEHRLKARAILDEIKLSKQFDEIKQNPSADAWQQHIIARGEITALWQLIYQISNTSNREINRENYAITVFNYGMSYALASDFHQNDEDKAVYLNLLHQASKQFDLALQINPNLENAAYNWGYALQLEAELPDTKLEKKRRLWQEAGEKYALALRIKPDKLDATINWGIVLSNEANALFDTELTEKRRLWQEAGKKYASALYIQPDEHDAANNWYVALNNEANALHDTKWEEKFNLWRNALNKVQTLQNLSEKHQQSSAIQNLVNQIERKIADLEKRKPLS